MMAENPTQRCIICSVADPNLSVCRDVSSWETLLHAAQVRNHKTILDVIVRENGMPEFSVLYHRSCRATFTHKKDLLKLSEPIPHQNQQSSSQRSSSRDTSTSSSVILPNRCIFCKKEKYKPRSSTREKTRSCMEFRSDDKVRSSAKLHIKTCSELSSIANEVLALCFKDLISSEAKYHASCYKSFVRISYADTPNLEALERKKDTVDSISLHDQVYEAAYSFCSDLIKSPRIVEMKAIKDIMSAEAERIGIEVLPSQFKNLVRKLSNKFQGDLKFAYPSYNKVLVYPSTLTVDEVVCNYFEIRAQIDSL